MSKQGWLTFGAVQLVGCILASYGAMYSESAFVRGSRLCGFLLLLPGNLPAMALDQTLWHIQTGKIFFPVAVGCNALFWIICSAVIWRIVRGEQPTACSTGTASRWSRRVWCSWSLTPLTFCGGSPAMTAFFLTACHSPFIKKVVMAVVQGSCYEVLPPIQRQLS